MTEFGARPDVPTLSHRALAAPAAGTCIVSSMATPRRPTPKKPTPKKPDASGGGARRRVPSAVLPIVNEAMRERYAKHLEAFQRARGAELAQWDAAYESIGEILSGEAPLYLAGGYKTAQAFVDAVLPGMKLETVRDYVRVAQRFSPDDEKKHGVTKLVALLDYLEARNGGELPPTGINPDRTRVRQGSETVPFSSLSVDAMRDVARAAKGKGSKPRREAPEVTALRAVFSKHGLGNASVSLSADRWTFGRVERRQFKDLAAALLKAEKAP